MGSYHLLYLKSPKEMNVTSLPCNRDFGRWLRLSQSAVPPQGFDLRWGLQRSSSGGSTWLWAVMSWYLVALWLPAGQQVPHRSTSVWDVDSGASCTVSPIACTFPKPGPPVFLTTLWVPQNLIMNLFYLHQLKLASVEFCGWSPAS